MCKKSGQNPHSSEVMFHYIPTSFCLASASAFASLSSWKNKERQPHSNHHMIHVLCIYLQQTVKVHLVSEAFSFSANLKATVL